ncbi:MAG: hypothetical protein A2285_04930 [Elusimicrobia bacterium RIFOXYA12_FULL_57_11]|nr:MAG: hypothetical protein A2285_04930 [Elusimicrobia bacterium RIFOXYA12_FULL_57_11]
MINTEPDLSPAALAGAENTRLRRLMPALVAIFTFFVFSPALNNGFVNWDDTYNLVNNYKYRGVGWEQLKWMFTTFHCGPYQPLSWLTYGFDYLIWGMNPFGYHLTNVALHSINAAVFYFLCLELFFRAGASGGRRETGLFFSAGFAALVFAIHPLRVESVAWVTERRDLLSGLFYLLAILIYIRRSSGAEAPSANSGSMETQERHAQLWTRHWLSLLLFLLALLSKGIVVSLPLALLVLDIYPLKRLPLNPLKWTGQAERQALMEKVPYLALAAVFGLVGYAGQAEFGAILAYKHGLGDRAAHTLFSTGFYIWKTLAPVNLVPVYQLPAQYSGFPFLAAGLLLFSGVTAAAVAAYRRWPWVLAAWLFYLVTLGPVSGIVKIGSQAAADRYSYLSCLVFAALAGAAFRAGQKIPWRAVRLTLAAAAVLLIVVFSALTWRQTLIWRNSENLWRHTLAVNPALDIAHLDLGVALAKQGRTSEAIECYKKALEINPGYLDARINLCAALAVQGNSGGSEQCYKKTLGTNPDCVDAHIALGAALGMRGENEEAAAYFRAALKIDPDSASAHNNLSVALTAQGKHEEAYEHTLAAALLNPESIKSQSALGDALVMRGKYPQAVSHYRTALKIDPDSAAINNSLGVALAMQGKIDEAIEHCRTALRLKPDFLEAYFNMGLHLSAQGKFKDAEASYRAALRINPDEVKVHNNLGRVLASQGKRAEAVKHFREALRLSPGNPQVRRNLEFVLQN